MFRIFLKRTCPISLVLPLQHNHNWSDNTRKLNPQFNTQLPISKTKPFHQYLTKDYGICLGIAGLAFFQSMLGVASPILLAKVLYKGLSIHLFKLLGVLVTKSFVVWLNTQLIFVWGERLIFRIKQDLYQSILNKELGWFDYRYQNEILNRLENDCHEFKHVAKQLVSLGLKSVFEIAGSVVSLLYLNTKLSLILASYLPMVYVGMSHYGFYLRSLSKSCKLIDQECGNVSAQSLQNIKTVRAFGAEEIETQKYENALLNSKRNNEYLGMHMGLFQGLVQLSTTLMIGTILLLGGRLVTNGEMTREELMGFLTATQQTQKALESVGILFGQGVKALSSAARIREYLEDGNHVKMGGLAPDIFNGRIEFKNVSFRYPSRPDHPVLNDFSLVVPKGKVVALCGRSGSGKSTLGQLIERFYDAESGTILIDGHPIESLDPFWIRSHVGYISQEPTLFATSILENIKYGQPSATQEQVELAAKKANALEFIEAFPDKFETIVGERGSTLSGGQKQRIAIARAILKNPNFLILDEATSALDNHSEKIVQDALDTLMQGRTVLVIAHRLSTIRKADLIVVMGTVEEGGVLEMGTHHELLKKKSHYYNLHSQMH